MTKNRNNNSTWNLILIIAILFALIATGFLFSCLIAHKQAEVAATEPPAPTEPPVFAIMESFDSVMEEKIAESYNATVNAKKAFWNVKQVLIFLRARKMPYAIISKYGPIKRSVPK